MPSNDCILLKNTVEQVHSNIASSMGLSDFFEIYSAEQALKDYDLSYQEIETGVVGSGNDGGVDSAYIFINNEFIPEDIDDFSPWKKGVNLELVFIQSKYSESFGEDAILKLDRTSRDLLALENELEQFSRKYNSSLLKTIERFRTIQNALNTKIKTLKISYYYISLADNVHPNVESQVTQLKNTVSSFYSDAIFKFEFIGAKELLAFVRKQPDTSHALSLSENPMSSQGKVFICLPTIKAYFEFIKDEEGKLKRHIFESNVRDYQGKTAVNKEIQETLENSEQEGDFWWLNNGVTILATDAKAQGGKTLIIDNPEIVNGLQTSNEIFNHFNKSPDKDDIRTVLVRVIVPETAAVRDAIIKATNSQTSIPPVSLRATDKIHRDIEDYLKGRGFFYDRRKNFYKNDGKPIDQIISLSFLSQALMAMVLQRPDTARARPSTLLKKDEEYQKIFDTNHPINLYYVATILMKRVDSFLKNKEDLDIKDRTNIRFYVAYSLLIHLCGKTNASIQEISNLIVSDISDNAIEPAYRLVKNQYETLGGTDQIAKGTELLKELKQIHLETFQSVATSR